MQRPGNGVALSFIRTVTVGPGISPDLLTPLRMARCGRSRACATFAAITAGGEFHPALRTLVPALRPEQHEF